MKSWLLLILAIGCADITIPSGQTSVDAASGGGSDAEATGDSTLDERDAPAATDAVEPPCQDEPCLQSVVGFSALGGAPIATTEGSLTLGLTWSASIESVPDGPTMTLGVLTGLLRTLAPELN